MSTLRTEYFEIASYQALIAGAQLIGDLETVRMCQSIIQDEQRLAQWLEQSLPMTVQEFLQTRTQATRTA